MTKRSTMSRIYIPLLWCFCLGSVWLVPRVVWANCLGLYQQKKFVAAATCMVKKATQLGRRNRSESGRWMRNAIKAWKLAADATRDGVKAAYYRERAFLLIQVHNKRKLYEDVEQRNRLRQEMRRLTRRIGFSSLVVISNHPKAKICAKGFKFRRCATRPLWSLRVRPGSYQVSVSYPLLPPVSRSKSITLSKSKQRVMLFRPPYANVSIVTNDGKASMSLSGNGLGTPLRGNGALWTVMLPPGAYELALKYPQHPMKRQKFTVVGQVPKVLNFARPPDLPVLRIESQPPAARVLINGKPRGSTRLSLPLEAGSHQVQLRKHCYLPISKVIRTQPGKENALTVVLKRDPAFLGWKRSKDNEKMLKVLGWIGVGLGVVTLGVSVAVHFSASDLQNSAIADLRENRISNFQQFQEKGQTGNDLRSVGFVTLGAGAVVLGAGIVSLFLASPGPLSAIKCVVGKKRK